MKKTRCIIALVAAMFAVGAFVFVACKKDEVDAKNISSLKTSMNSENVRLDFGEYMQKATIDSIAEELACFHGAEMSAFLENPVLLNLSNQESFDLIWEMMTRDISAARFPVSINYFNIRYVSKEDCRRICSFIIAGGGKMTDYDFDNIVRENFNLAIIGFKINALWDVIEESIEESSTYNGFVDAYYDKIKLLLSDLELNDYMPVCFAASVCLNSFEVWCDYYYGNSNEKEKTFWTKVKEKAVEIKEKIKPYVDADADGAAYGALTGAAWGAIAGSAVGGVGAVPGGEAGAISGAYTGAIAGSWQYHNNHKRQ